MPKKDRTEAYEVHVLVAGKWEIHAGYASDQRKIAIRDAKSLDTISTIGGSKVVREIYDEKNQTSRDEIIFLSPKAGGSDKPIAPAPTPARKPPPPSGMGAMGIEDLPTKKKLKAAPSKKEDDGAEMTYEIDVGSVGIRVFIRLILITLVSIVIAGMIAMVAGVVFKESQYFVKLLGNSRPNILFGIFIGTFLLTALPLALKFLSAEPAPKKRQVYHKRVENEDRQFVPTPVFPEDRPEREDEDDFHLPKVDAALVVGMSNRLGRVLKDKISLETRTYLEGLPSLHDLLPEEAKVPARDAMNFLRTGLADERLKSIAIDNVTRFGISLFMAGAIDGLARKNGLDQKAVTRTLSYMVQSLGFRKGQADSFARKCDQYLLADARYMQMYLDGRSGMLDALDGNALAGQVLQQSITDWNQPKSREDKKQEPTSVAVMFTDIVGSTRLTQDKGDRGAMEVVYAHNEIVRQAIKLFRGKEVKHLGDGIMSSFPVTSAAVEAAVYIQEKIRERIERQPDLPLEVKIGIDAGEPIAEDDDLFGSTVQMAARIVDKASTGEIYVSETVKGMCSGKPLRFDELGRYDLKGIEGGATLFEVVWNDLAKSKPQQPEAVADDASEEPESEPEDKAEGEVEGEKVVAPEDTAEQQDSEEETALVAPAEKLAETTDVEAIEKEGERIPAENAEVPETPEPEEPAPITASAAKAPPASS